MKNKCFQSIAGFEELTKSGDIKICFLHDPEYGYQDGKPKRPEGLTANLAAQMCEKYLLQMGLSSWKESEISERDYIASINGKFNYRSADEANLPKNVNRNLGFVFPQDPEPPFWVCIDVDGQDYGYMVKNNPDVKMATRAYLCKCLSHGLKKRGIKFVCIQTTNNGFHFYFKTKTAYFKDHLPSSFLYPNSQVLMEKVDKTIFGSKSMLASVINQPMAKRALEIFTAGKMVVAPGSSMDGKEYTVTDDGIRDFREVTVYEDGPVEDLISSILIDDCFFSKEIQTEEQVVKSNLELNISIDKRTLSETNIKNIGDFIIYAFQHIPGQKHYATLALGGFLYSQNISQDSIADLGEYIIDNAPENLFNSSKEDEKHNGFLAVLIHDSCEDTEKQKTGLTTLKKIFEETEVPLRELTKILWTNAAPDYHIFTPNGIYADTYKEVTVDFKNKETRLLNLKTVIDDEGVRQAPKVLNSQVIKHVLTDINYIDDISASRLSHEEKMPISFYIQSRLKPSHLYIYKNTKEMIENYDSLPLAHQKGSNNILALVIDEYESIGLIGSIERSTIPGIYLSRDGKTLRRFIQKEGEVVEVKPFLPNKEKLIEALNLLKRVNDVYPWYDDKFATFVKLGMLLPYGYVFKTVYGSFIRGIILYGEGGTCKSSASELLIRMNVPSESIEEKEIDYILPGSEFSSEYRMGSALHRHSYPIMIEEVENVFANSDNRDLIKNAITRKFIRNPGGEYEYYSRAIPIFSANELDDEIEKSGMFRRFLILNFVNGERGDKPEVEEGLSFLNTNGVRNSRFKDLYVISEFIFYDLSNHLDYFALNPQQIITNVLKDMEQYTNLDLSWLINTDFEKYYQSDRSSEDQTDLSMILETLRYHFNKSINIGGIGSNTDERFLENLIEDKYSYIYRIQNQRTDGVLITGDFNKFYKKSFPNAKKLSLDRLAEVLFDNLDFKNDVKVSKMKPNGFKSRIKGVFIHWEDFCSIFNIRINKEEEE